MHRPAVAALIALAAVPICVLVWANARGDWARGQLTPFDEVHWPGHQVVIIRSPGSCVEDHRLLVEQDGQVVFEEVFRVRSCNLLEGEEAGFVAGLNADRDPELEIVHCNDGVVEGYVEPGPMGDGVHEHPGASASAAANEVCAAYVDALRYTGAVSWFLAGCVAPAALPIGLVFLFRRRRERASTTRSAPLHF